MYIPSSTRGIRCCRNGVYIRRKPIDGVTSTHLDLLPNVEKVQCTTHSLSTHLDIDDSLLHIYHMDKHLCRCDKIRLYTN